MIKIAVCDDKNEAVALIEKINEIFEKAKNIHKDITNGKENINITYVTEFLNMEKNKIKEVLDSHLYIDVLRKSSVKGIQKDDILIEINDMEVQKYGSQGQNRTVMLVLKLANFEVLREKKRGKSNFTFRWYNVRIRWK